MSAYPLTPDFLTFLSELSDNNNRDWFNQNKKRFKSNVEQPFKDFVSIMIGHLQKELSGLDHLEAKDCIFRIYRDVRFSADKSPYKTKVSALITPGGRKDMSGLGLYNELSSDDFRVYSGLYQLDSNQLKNVRTHISYNLDRFHELITRKDFVKTFGAIQGDKNKRLPKEFIEDAEQQPLLYNKQFYYFTKFEPNVILNEGLVNKVVETFLVARPLSEFLIEGLEG